MSKDINISFKGLPQAVGRLGHRLVRIAPLGFLLLVAALYGFLLLRITTLSNAQPDTTEISTEISKLTPHIDEKAAAQLQGLEDNSVNVQTLFNDARNNPFGE
jgi:hypothetical protein